jgi:hypothetical protein
MHNFHWRYKLELEASLNSIEPQHSMAHRGHSPNWKRAHHDWRFWVGLLLMLTAMAVYVGSDDLVLAPWGRSRAPAASHKVP